MTAGFQTSIRFTVVGVFTVATLLTAALAIGLQYYFGQVMAKEAAADLYATAASGIAAELRSMSRTNATVIELLESNTMLLDAESPEKHLAIFTRVLENNPLYYGVYLGSSDGRFYEVINLNTSEHARRALRALPTDRWVVVSMQSGEQEARRHFSYLDVQLNSRFARSEPTDFNVSQRPWYTSAIAFDAVQFSEPYLFAQLGVPGRTVSKRIAGSDTVVAIDMTMATISSFLSRHKAAEHGDIFLYHEDGRLVASSLDVSDEETQPGTPQLFLTAQERDFVQDQDVITVSNELDWPPIDYAQTGQPAGYSIDVIQLIAQMTGLKFRFINGYSWPDLVRRYRAGEIDLLQSVVASDDNRQMGLLGRQYLELSPVLVSREQDESIDDIAQLNFATLAIPSGWATIPIVRRHFPNIGIVEAESTLHALQLVLDGTVTAALDSDIVLRHVAASSFLSGLRFNVDANLGDALLPDTLHIMVPGTQPQLRTIIDKAIAAIDQQQLEVLRDRWLGFDAGTAVARVGSLPSESLVQIAANPQLQGQLLEIEHLGQPYLAFATPVGATTNPFYLGVLSSRAAVVAPFLDRVQLSILLTTGFLLLAIPLSWYLVNPIVRPIRQLAVQNEKVQRREYAEVERVSSHVLELDELSASMVKMVASIQTHEREQRALMDAFIELIAQAIDDKSAYTGGHCKRVPELAFMLAEQASASQLPAFRNFHLATEDEWREFRIAAWLHDCGKITTPEHIVDKGSKLETIYNRIHEVRTRFEVLLRDARIDYLEQVIDQPGEKAEHARQLELRHVELVEDFAFVASCNIGGEFLDQGKLNRLQEIAKKTWQRNFDDRIGLSPLEEMRIADPGQALPVTEQLLNDKPEHIIAREQSTQYPQEFGIDMEIPEHLYNLGEIYNLSISRGTLTAEDRFKINEHMISTIKILESLPFPEELKNVPRYASTHHETMKGTGYPRKLPGKDLTILERVLAIADIFEALTASDRPYKKAKSVSEAIVIMEKMAEDNHIDRDCFELFVRSGVHLQYASKFLNPAQSDTVVQGLFPL